jgi:hypothetical protein
MTTQEEPLQPDIQSNKVEEDFQEKPLKVSIQSNKVVVYRFNQERTLQFVLCIATTMCVISSIFMIGGTDIRDAIIRNEDNQVEISRKFQYRQTLKDKSLLLFPDTFVINGQIIDTFYWIVIPIAIFVLLFIFCIEHKVNTKFILKYHLHMSSGFLIICILSHLFGNIHYQFYCAIGSIPEYNCFWMFDTRSFSSGPAGLILVFFMVNVVLLVVNIISPLVAFLYQIITCRLFYDRIEVPKEEINI